MSANVFKYENRLAKTLVRTGGMSADEAITSAQAAVEQVREPTIAEIDETLASIFVLCAEVRSADDPSVPKIYAAANRIIGTAGVFELAELGQAAYSLCELLTRFQATSRYSEAMVKVHLDGLRLLRHPQEHTRQHRQEVLKGLRSVVACVC